MPRKVCQPYFSFISYSQWYKMANNIKHTHELFIKPRELYVELYFMKSTLFLQTEIKTFNQLINVCIAIIIVRNFYTSWRCIFKPYKKVQLYLSLLLQANPSKPNQVFKTIQSILISSMLELHYNNIFCSLVEPNYLLLSKLQ